MVHGSSERGLLFGLRWTVVQPRFSQIEDLENGLSPRQKRKAPDYKNLSRYFS
jgi:hypothetical protein